ncbi:MAG TPA: transposase [Nocardioides sp.]|uniref:transposase n=1 Tax=Nocardioides sp. TaxID=35761 RepID=UPI002D7E7BBB|nr:transposase [Nocardioides sp.]HET6652551.1 transposase [Nocardioides sp.]
MRVSVLTLDQQRSSTNEDAVPALLDALDAPALPAPPLRPFQRTAGDEVQGVLDDPDVCVEVVARVLRADGWYIGIGIGDVDAPLPAETRAGRGQAFVRARTAVTRAKHDVHHLAVVAGDRTGDPVAEHLETVLGLWAGILERRTDGGWAVHDLLATGLSYAEAGERLGITQSAVSQRARTAGIVDERRARALVSDLWGRLLA